MSTFQIKTFALSSLGAIALSATCIFAAVGPAHAANAPFTIGDWQHVVSDKVSNAADPVAGRLRPGKALETMLALHFTAGGDYAGASIARSSGDAGLDRHAIAVADRTAYPALPAGYRGQPQTVILRLAYGSEQEVAQHFAKTAKVSVDVASAANAGGKQIAVK